MPSHSATSCASCASSILAILSIIWCSWVTCSLNVRSLLLLQSPGALTGYEVSFPSLFPFLLRSHCPLASVKETHVVIPDLWTAMPLASPASPMSISLSTGGFSIIPPIKLLTSWVAIVAGLPDVSALAFGLLQSSRAAGSHGLGSVRCMQSNSAVRMSLSGGVAKVFRCGCFWSSPSLPATPLDCVDSCACPSMLTRWLSSDGPGVLGVPLRVQFDVEDRSALSVFSLMLPSLT